MAIAIALMPSDNDYRHCQEGILCAAMPDQDSRSNKKERRYSGCSAALAIFISEACNLLTHVI